MQAHLETRQVMMRPIGSPVLFEHLWKMTALLYQHWPQRLQYCLSFGLKTVEEWGNTPRYEKSGECTSFQMSTKENGMSRERDRWEAGPREIERWRNRANHLIRMPIHSLTWQDLDKVQYLYFQKSSHNLYVLLKRSPKVLSAFPNTS
jgi:hypothetical protein